MHLKQIPTEAIAAVKAHPLVIGVAALAVAGGGYYVYQQRASVAANDSGGSVLTRGDPNAGIGSTASPSDITGALSGIINSALGATSGGGATGSTTNNGTIDTSTTPVSTPVSTPSTPIDTSSTSVPSVSGGAGSVGSYTQQLLDQQTLQINDNFVYQMSQLQLTAAISATNAFLTNAALQSANYGIAAGLAQSFLYSGNQAGMGVITGPDGMPIIDFSMIAAQNSNKNGWDSNLATMINTGVFANFWNQTGITPGATPGTSSGGSPGTGNTMPNYFAAFLGGGSPITSPSPTPTPTPAPVVATQHGTNTTVVPSGNANFSTPTIPTISSPATNSGGFQLPSITQPTQAPSIQQLAASYAPSSGGGGGRTDYGGLEQQF